MHSFVLIRGHTRSQSTASNVKLWSHLAGDNKDELKAENMADIGGDQLRTLVLFRRLGGESPESHRDVEGTLQDVGSTEYEVVLSLPAC